MKNKFSIKKNGYVKRVRNADRMGLGEDSGEFKVNYCRYYRIIAAGLSLLDYRCWIIAAEILGKSHPPTPLKKIL